jgi:YVTN family beta-propeller protein
MVTVLDWLPGAASMAANSQAEGTMIELVCSTDTDSGVVTVVERVGQNSYVLRGKIPVGNAPRGSVKFTKDGRGYVSNGAGDTISEIDVISNREIGRIKVGVAPRGVGIVPGDRFALVSNSGSNTVSVVDLSHRREVTQVAVGRDPRHMAISKAGDWAYVSIWGSDYVSKLDIQPLTDPMRTDVDTSAQAVREVGRMQVRSDAHPYSTALDPSGELLFVANTQSQYLSIFSTKTDKLHAEVDLGSKGSRGIAFSPDGKVAFVSVEDTSEVVAIDVPSMAITRRIEVGPGPRGIAVSRDGGTLYSSAFSRNSSPVNARQPGARQPSSFNPNTVTVVDLSAPTGTARAVASWSQVDVGKGPCSVAIFYR